ncbi:hypothetical protein [uncultured Muribaculum sp.]|nr:hypothetical protein [uncultured Muribaculum sp.]
MTPQGRNAIRHEVGCIGGAADIRGGVYSHKLRAVGDGQDGIPRPRG